MAITYSIDGGADAAKFNINSTTGALTFKAAPDFEAPGDSNKDNIYEVSVKATDATGLASSKLVKVTVTDVIEGSPPQITSAGAISVKENATTVMTVTATDPDDTTTPPVEPPIEPPVQTGWPDASNTGVPAGTTLTNYTGPSTITTAGYTVQNKRITANIEVQAADVKFERCEFVANGWFGINSDRGTRLVVTDCTFKGPGTGGQMAAAILGDGTFTRLNISGTSLGLNLQGKSTVKDCYIHDLGYAGTDPHYDGIMVQGGNTDTLIEHNFVQTPGSGGTAGILITPEFGNISNVTVNRNRFLGRPSYQAYATANPPPANTLTGVVFTNNEMERGAYGYWNILGNTPVRTGNKDATTGANIDNA